MPALLSCLCDQEELGINMSMHLQANLQLWTVLDVTFLNKVGSFTCCLCKDMILGMMA